MTDKSEKESRLINSIKTIEELAELTAIVRPIDAKKKSGKSQVLPSSKTMKELINE